MPNALYAYVPLRGILYSTEQSNLWGMLQLNWRHLAYKGGLRGCKYQLSTPTNQLLLDVQEAAHHLKGAAAEYERAAVCYNAWSSAGTLFAIHQQSICFVHLAA
jgi:hypothetical protein